MFDNNHDKRKKLTIDFLTEKGYPDISPERVLELSYDIYKVWEKNEVVPEGMKLESFTTNLKQLYLENRLMSMFGVSLK